MDQSEINAGAIKEVRDTTSIKSVPPSGSYGAHDAEKQGVQQPEGLKRKLKSRHLQMIAIGMFVKVFAGEHLLIILQVERSVLVYLLDLEVRFQSQGLLAL